MARQQLAFHRGTEIRTTGDGFLATFDGPARAVRCASEIVRLTAATGSPIRAGLHTGEVEIRDKETGGIAVHVAARIAALANSSQVLTSRTVKDLIAGSGIKFSDKGTYTLKGVPESWQLYEATVG
ncbi:MAG: adenylate/guanylate cyclase domain-containing protein [Acidimicrobiales bacterium]|jgi:class 3 adenylate cyclase